MCLPGGWQEWVEVRHFDRVVGRVHFRSFYVKGGIQVMPNQISNQMGGNMQVMQIQPGMQG
jgi:predicted secreted acid phosphatase